MTRVARRRSVAGAVVVLAALLAGCAQSNTPTSYADQDNLTQTNFMQGCTEIYGLNGTTSTLGDGASESVCQCAWDWIVQNIPFNADDAKAQGKPTDPNFVSMDKKLGEDQSAMPQEVTDGIKAACPGFDSISGPVSATSTPQ